jgi:hypothetical protein
VTEGGENNGRDAAGRFAVGNAGGPGSRRRPADFRRALEESIGPAHVAAVMRKATKMALEGNLGAIRFVAERTCGKPAEAPVENEPLSVAVPRLRTAADCSFAIEQLVDGICKGRVEPDKAKVLIDAIQVRVKAIEVGELEQRLIELEKNARTVDHNGRR